MAEDTFLPDDLLRQLMSVGEVDLLVGLSAHGSTNATRQAIHAIEQSFQQFFVRQRVAIITVDGDVKIEDEVPDSDAIPVPNHNKFSPGLSSLRTIHHITASFSNPPPQGIALRTILAAADLLRAKACAVVSPATSNLTPEWIANLLKPVYRENFDFVAPLYARHKFHGLLARNLLYPMSRAIFGKRIRELYSDEWAFSGRLGALCLDQEVWHEEAIRARPEAWMAISAIASEMRCCQVFLGAKPQPAGASAMDIVEALRQTVGSLFWCLETQQATWLEREGSDPVLTFGPDHEFTSEPMDLSRSRMLEMFRSGVTQLESILTSILDPETHSEIKRLASLPDGEFRFAGNLWVKTLYDFASSYHHALINRDHLVQALVPLYRGKIVSFLTEHANSSPDELEADSEKLCLEFEQQKTYLREKWKQAIEVQS